MLEPFSTANDSKELWFDNSFSLFSYYGAKQTFTATAANGDGNDIAWEVDPNFLSVSEPRVEGDKSTVDITWDGETVESIDRTPFYAMLKSNPFEKITGTAYLSNGSAPSETDMNDIDPGSKTEFESEEVRKFVEEMYATGLTQDNSVYDLSSFGDTSSSTPDYSKMSDEDILKLFEEKQAEEAKLDETEKDTDNEADNETEKILEDDKAENSKEEVKADKSDKVDEDKSDSDEKETLYNKEETQSKTEVSDKVDDTEDKTADKTEDDKTADEKTEKKTEKKTVTEEVTKKEKVEKAGTKTTTTEIVSQEPIVETVTKTVTEEVPSTKEMRVETVVDSAYDEETGETVLVKEEKTITVPTTELVEKTETVEEVVGTNYKVRETVAVNDGENTTTEVNDHETERVCDER